MEQNWHDKIEAYIEGDLSASERKEMEAAMRDDPALAKEVRVWQLEQEALLQLRLKKVREQFAERSRHLFEEQKPEPLRVAWYRSPWVRVAAVLVPLMVAIWWFMQEPEDVEPPVVDNRNVVEEKIVSTPEPQAPDTSKHSKEPEPSPNANFTLQIPPGVFAILQSYANTQTASSGEMESIQKGLDQAYTAGKYSVADSLSEKILQDQQMLDTLFEDSKSSLRFVTLSYFSKVRLGRDVQQLLSKCRDLSKAKLVNNSNMQFIYDWIEVLTLLSKPVRDPKEFKEKLDKLISRFPDHRDMDNSAGDFEKMLLSLQKHTKIK